MLLISYLSPSTALNVAIIGSGPAGLASALSLSRLLPSANITIVDSSPDPSAYDPTRSFLYLLDSRGQKWTNNFIPSSSSSSSRSPSIALEDIGIPSTDFKLSVLEVREAKPPVSLPIVDKENRKKSTPYWIQRGHFVKLLSTLLPPTVASHSSVTLNSIVRQPSTDSYILSCTKISSAGENSIMTLDADLVVGADGVNSKVRELSHPPSSKSLKISKSPAGGLHFKSLQIKSTFSGYNSTHSTDLSMAYAVRPFLTGDLTSLRLGILPVLPSAGAVLNVSVPTTRPANVVTRPDHDITGCETGEEVEDLMRRNFPQLNWDGGGVVEEGEFERFAKSKPVWFPHPQRSTKLSFTETGDGGGSGIVLIGDSAHSFPPDIGQGVNAALMDVLELEGCLERGGCRGKEGIGEALNEYERRRMPEVKALVELCRIANPYQYSQTGTWARVGKRLWAINFALRLLLSKATGGLLKPNAFYAMQKEESYVKVLNGCRRTTAFIYAALAAAAWRCARILY